MSNDAAFQAELKRGLSLPEPLMRALTPAAVAAAVPVIEIPDEAEPLPSSSLRRSASLPDACTANPPAVASTAPASRPGLGLGSPLPPRPAVSHMQFVNT